MALSIERERALAPLTTLELGGPATFFAEVTSEADVAAAFQHADAKGLDVFVLGGGSNIVFSDGGFSGLVLRVSIPGEEVGSDGTATVGAGVEWAPFVARMVERGFAGVECLAGIPGRVGATPIQNVGAYGQEVAEVVTAVRAYDRERQVVVSLLPSECDFSYRNSRFKRTPGRFVVLSVTFLLRPNGDPTIRYAELESQIRDKARPVLSDVFDAVLRLRRKKSMVIDATDPNRRSVGSFFLNPILDTARVTGDLENGPRYPAGEGKTKLSAAWLIENAGMKKGTRRGAVGISTNHSLAIVHHGGGSTRDLLALANEIRETVRARFGVELVPEATIVQ